MELVEKTELLRRLSVYALSKIHLDRYKPFRKILLILSWDTNLNPGSVYGIQNENLLYVLPFHDCIFSGDGFYYVHTKTRNELEPPGRSWNYLERADATWNELEPTGMS